MGEPLRGKFADVPGQQAMDLDADDPGALVTGGCGLPGCPVSCPGALHGCDYHHDGDDDAPP